MTRRQLKLRSVRASGRVTHCVRLRSGLEWTRCRDLMLPLTPVPPVPNSRGRTVIFDIVEYVIMEWTIPNESRI